MYEDAFSLRVLQADGRRRWYESALHRFLTEEMIWAHYRSLRAYSLQLVVVFRVICCALVSDPIKPKPLLRRDRNPRCVRLLQRTVYRGELANVCIQKWTRPNKGRSAGLAEGKNPGRECV